MSGVAIEHARDISDATFLTAVRKTKQLRPLACTSRWDLQAVLAGLPQLVMSYAEADLFGDYAKAAAAQDLWDEMERRVPGKVVLAKIRRLIARNLITGCPCGCRGDIELTELTDPMPISPAVRDQYRALANQQEDRNAR